MKDTGKGKGLFPVFSKVSNAYSLGNDATKCGFVGGTQMNYKACLDIRSIGLHKEDTSITIGKEGLSYGSGVIDFADVGLMKPINHRVFITLLDGSQAEISMLGFSFDGFWEELVGCFAERTRDALFIEEEKLMDCEGEYNIPGESPEKREAGRGRIQLYTDAVCILPESSHAVRIPLCFTEHISLNGYQLLLRMRTGEEYSVGKMGYDTKPFAERALRQEKSVKQQRMKLLQEIAPQEVFTEKGLFRTRQEGEYWLAAYGKDCCAVELFTGEKAATYLYRFANRQLFGFRLEEAMEAVGSYREIIFLPEEQLNEKPLYRMAVHRSAAVRFLRGCSAGRIIHNAAHAEKLAEFLGA